MSERTISACYDCMTAFGFIYANALGGNLDAECQTCGKTSVVREYRVSEAKWSPASAARIATLTSELAEARAERDRARDEAEHWHRSANNNFNMLSESKTRAVNLRTRLAIAAEFLCSAECPSTWPTGEKQPHSVTCREITWLLTNPREAVMPDTTIAQQSAERADLRMRLAERDELVAELVTEARWAYSYMKPFGTTHTALLAACDAIDALSARREQAGGE